MDSGEPLDAQGMRLRGAAQWQLISAGGSPNDIFIQVGSLPGGRLYVDHLGFGARRFGCKSAAWQAVQRLMTCHAGKCDQVDVDRRPWFKLRRSDGSRLPYDTDGKCLYECWGKYADSIWEKYLQAINSGIEFRAQRATNRLMHAMPSLNTLIHPNRQLGTHWKCLAMRVETTGSSTIPT